MFGGAPACSSGGADGIVSRATWILNPANLAWERKDPLIGGPAADSLVATTSRLPTTTPSPIRC